MTNLHPFSPGFLVVHGDKEFIWSDPPGSKPERSDKIRQMEDKGDAGAYGNRNHRGENEWNGSKPAP